MGVHSCARQRRAVIKNKGHVWHHRSFWNGRGCLGPSSQGPDDRAVPFVPLLGNCAGGNDDSAALAGSFRSHYRALFGWEFERGLTKELFKLEAAFGLDIARQMCGLMCPLELNTVVLF